MPLNIKAAMAKAAELTRSRKLMDATRVIQSALSGAPEAKTGPERGTAPRGRGAGLPPTIHLPPAGPWSATEAAADAKPARPTSVPPPFTPQRTRRPLGDVLDLLSRAKQARPGGFPLSGRTSPAPEIPHGAQFLTRSFSNAAGTRRYRLYVPAGLSDGPRPLVVMLHGCKQDPDDFAAGTGMNALAEEHGFLVAYPEQPGSANAMSCWNWFDPNDQRRDAGEPSIIAGITEEIAGEFNVDRARIFVAGLSAGGAMAVIMGATYPDLYNAVGVHSGLAYGAATDVPGAFTAMRGDGGMGILRSAARSPATSANPVRTIIFHGDADQTVHPSNAERIVAALNPEAEEAQDTRSGTAGGRAYSQILIQGRGGKPVGEHWVIKGGGHAWSGGDPAGSYTDPSGPSASREMVRFFLG